MQSGQGHDAVMSRPSREVHLCTGAPPRAALVSGPTFLMVLSTPDRFFGSHSRKYDEDRTDGIDPRGRVFFVRHHTQG